MATIELQQVELGLITAYHSLLVKLLEFTLVIELLSSDFVNEDIDYTLC